VRRKSVLKSSHPAGQNWLTAAPAIPPNPEIYLVRATPPWFSQAGPGIGASRRSCRCGQNPQHRETDDAKIYKNTEIQALNQNRLGFGHQGGEFTNRPCVINRIVIMTDADVEWRPQSAPLLLTFFYRYQEKLCWKVAYIYTPSQPLYNVGAAVKTHLLLNKRQDLKNHLEWVLAQGQLHNPAFQRAGRKMMPLGQALWENHHDPTTERVKRVEIGRCWPKPIASHNPDGLTKVAPPGGSFHRGPGRTRFDPATRHLDGWASAMGCWGWALDPPAAVCAGGR